MSLKPPVILAGRRPLRIFTLVGVTAKRGPAYVTGQAVLSMAVTGKGRRVRRVVGTGLVRVACTAASRLRLRMAGAGSLSLTASAASRRRRRSGPAATTMTVATSGAARRARRSGVGTSAAAFNANAGSIVKPSWVAPGPMAADIDFVNQRAYRGDVGVLPFESFLNVQRTSPAYEISPDGRYQLYPANTPRIGYIPRTPRVNFIRNNTMQGAIAGTPGTIPTNWGVGSVPAGLTRTISLFNKNGVDCISLNFSGTTTASGFIQILTEARGVVAAANGQLWTGSFFTEVPVADPNVTSLAIGISEDNSVPNQVAFGSIAVPSFAFQRASYSRILSGTGTASVRSYVQTNTIPSGVAVNVTITLGWPQLEQSSAATAAIPTYGAVGAADVEATNLIRNNTMQGAVAGAPGTLPANWSFLQTGTGLTAQVLGMPLEAGIECIDIRVSGTPSNNGNSVIQFDANTAIPALVGQSWAESVFVKLLANADPGVRLELAERDSAGAFVAGSSSQPLGLSSTLMRYAVSRAVVSGAYASPRLLIPGTAGQALDFTIRIGLPQLERDYVTSPIRTMGTAVSVGPGNAGCRGILVEGAQTNLFLYSDDFTQTAWAKTTGATITPMASADAFGLTRITKDANGFRAVNQIFNGVAGALYTASAIVKAGSLSAVSMLITGDNGTTIDGRAVFDLAAGTINSNASVNLVGTPRMRPVGSGYFLIEVSATITNTTNPRVYIYPGVYNQATAGDIFIKNAQLEQWNPGVAPQGGASSPIRTTGAAAARAADVVTGTLASALAAPTVVVIGRPGILTLNATAVRLGSASDNIQLVRSSADASIAQLGQRAGGVSQAGTNTPSGTLADGTRFAAAFSAVTGDAALSVNGAAPVIRSNATAPTGLSDLIVGGGVQPWNGYIERISIRTDRVANANLPALSTLTA